MKIDFANPSAQFHAHKGEIETAILEVIRGNQYILGDQVKKFEENFATYIGVEKAIGVANGTDALELALQSLEIGAGDEVITVSWTAVATVAAIENVGASPVLVDIEHEFYTLDPNKLQEVLSPKTKAVLVVHLYGQPADMESISDFCNKNKLFLIEDVSQAHGATLNGKKLGSFGDVACFSCYPTKNLGAIGDAGIIATNNTILAEKILLLREYGWAKRYESKIPGRNSRLDEIQAAILNVKLGFLDTDNISRNKIANLYREKLDPNLFKTPIVRKSSQHAFHLFVIQSEGRDDLISHLNSHGIFPGIHYPKPIHLQEAYINRLKSGGDMSATETVSKKILSLPIYPELSLENVKKIIQVLNSFRS